MKTDQARHLRELHAELLKSLEEQNQPIQRQLQDIQRLITTISIQHRILGHLIPDDKGSRREQIYEADPDTCRWVLEPAGEHDSYRAETRDSFISWLRTGSNVLHISGNPGAGKSTLMKFISGNSRTQEALRAWAGSGKLVFGEFYFWAAGTEAQRTLPGMLKSMLFQILSQYPELIEHVFPHQLKQMKTSRFQSDASVEMFQSFGRKQIQEAFDLFLKISERSEYRICFLIDGLDEFQGGDLDHEDLAVRLKAWTAEGHIKLLVSSRPWRPFLSIFTAHPTMHLHDLNRSDIRKYAIRQLEQDREIRQIGLYLMEKTIEEIVEELVDQAQGIFLWAHLVLDTIRLDIRRRYSVDILKAKVREYPSDLDDLYDALRGPIEKSPIDRKLSNRMLLIAASAPESFRLLAIAFSWLPEDDKSGLLDPSFPPSTKCQPYPEQDVAERLRYVSDRVNGLTRGLLELVTVEKWEPPEVKFCHRTARDYLIANAKRHAALEESWPHFHQSDPYGRMYLAELIYCRASESSMISEYLNKPFCRSFSLKTIEKFEIPMRPLLSPKMMWDAASEESWPRFQQADPYGRTYLAELSYRGSPGSSVISEYLGKPFCRSFSLDTIRKFNIPLRPILSPRLLGDSDDYQIISQFETVSFLNYAAYCRLDQFVLSKVSSNSGTWPRSPGTNVLLASMYSAFERGHEDLDLALSLVRSQMSKDHMIKAEVQVEHLNSKNESPATLPVWVVALILGLKRILRDFSQGLNNRPDKVCIKFDKAWINHSLVMICSLLNDLGLQFSQSVSVTVESKVSEFAEGGGGTIIPRVNARRTFNTVQILEWAQHLDAGVINLQADDKVMEHQYSSWVSDTVCTIKEGYPIPMSQKYRIASWKLGSSNDSESSGEEYADFNWRVF